ncbi:DegT/DnrJ/EryC1/StrS family aminotransferase [Candidatus Daviesbacteria bacterium]|nr:DegT/DnrJ/EryC1/StrS family aminotransferase [Candidatus Daviesbacteria bacterium]
MILRADILAQYKTHKKEINSAIQKVLNSGYYILGKEVEGFEKEFARYLKVKFGVGVASGTDGLILSLKTLGIGVGDEVITSVYNTFATSSAIIAAGAIPKFVDIDYQTFLLDIKKIPLAITKKTKAIIPIHLFGNVVDIPALIKILSKQIPIIEDACQAHGSKISDQFAGSIAQIGVFSFYPTKNLGGYGDGGMVVTDNKKIEKRLKLLRNYGMIDKDHIIQPGVNSLLDELQAAILQIKLKYLEYGNQKRQEIVKQYKAKLRSDLFEFQLIPKNVYCNFHIFAARFKKNRAKFISYLTEKKIQTNIYYPLPLHLQKAFQFLGYKKDDFPIAERLAKEAIALPIYPQLLKENLDYIISTINFFK